MRSGACCRARVRNVRTSRSQRAAAWVSSAAVSARGPVPASSRSRSACIRMMASGLFSSWATLASIVLMAAASPLCKSASCWRCACAAARSRSIARPSCVPICVMASSRAGLGTRGSGVTPAQPRPAPPEGPGDPGAQPGRVRRLPARTRGIARHLAPPLGQAAGPHPPDEPLARAQLQHARGLLEDAEALGGVQMPDGRGRPALRPRGHRQIDVAEGANPYRHRRGRRHTATPRYYWAPRWRLASHPGSGPGGRCVPGRAGRGWP